MRAGVTETQPLQQEDAIGDAFSPHWEFAVKAVPAISAKVKSTFLIIKVLRLIIHQF